MSWLRDTFYNFVFPAFVASGKPTDQIGEPFDVRVSNHAPARLPSELKKLWTLCKEHNVPWSFDIRESNSYGGTSKYRESAKIHYQVMRDTLTSAQVALRTEKCDRLFLGGRDVWALAVLCERRRIPYLFVPELSRPVCDHPEVKDFLASKGFKGTELFLDTGFAGSIPRSLSKWYGEVPFKFRLMSQSYIQYKKVADPNYNQEPEKHLQQVKMMQVADPLHHVESKFQMVDCDPEDPLTEGKLRKAIEKYKRRPNQLFPNFAEARERALEAEYLAKFWTRGTFEQPCMDDEIYLGNAIDVYSEWKDKPNLRRWEDVSKLCVGLTDGISAVLVSMSDLKICPPFHGWWLTLPKGEKPHFGKTESTPGRIYQNFASKAEIQRAALLTSMLWRGIPYWKIQSKNEKPQYGFGDGKVQFNTDGTVVNHPNPGFKLTNNTNAITTTNSHVFIGPNMIHTGSNVTSGVTGAIGPGGTGNI